MAMYYTPIPHEFLEEMGELSDAEYGRLIRWCQTYSITGEEMELSGNERFYRIRCKNHIDKIKDSYEETSRKKSEAGRKGMEKRWHSDNTTITEDNTDNTAITSDNTPVTEITNKNKNINKNRNIKEKDNISGEILSKKKSVITAWNEAAEGTGIPNITDIKHGTQREQMLNARIKEYGLDTVLDAISEISKSDFLQGKANNWVIRFDWFIRPNNFVKVLEGNYRDNSTPRAASEKLDSSSWVELAKEMEER